MVEGFDITGIASSIGPWALAVTIVLALVRGDLVPRKTHDTIVSRRDEAIREMTVDRDYYRDQTLQLLRVADVAADRVQQALLARASLPRPDLTRERGEP